MLRMSVDRGFTWMDDETNALIDIWGKDSVQHELTSAKRNFLVYERIARELAEVGFNRTAYQCREKIKRLRKEYQIARYCVEHDISQKKPMKYYERVDQVFSRHRNSRKREENQSRANSDQEDELHFSFNPDADRDVTLSGNPSFQAMILSSPSTSGDGSLKMRVRMTSEEASPLCPNDSSDTLVDNEEDDNLGCNDLLDEDESPWVPNVVLIENEFDDKTTTKPEMNGTVDTNHSSNKRRLNFEESEEYSHKRPRHSQIKTPWFKNMMDKVTDRFLRYQECADSNFLDKFVLIERERIKRDEALQKLWIGFEERCRKEEQQHELKIMGLFGQFVSQIIKNDHAKKK